MTRRVQISAGGAYDLGCQVVWYPRYRRPVLAGLVKGRCEALAGAKASGRGWRVVALEIMPDHVHLVVKAHRSGCPSRAASQFTGFSWRLLQAGFTLVRSRLPALWSRPYVAASVGAVLAEAVRRCIGVQHGWPGRKERVR